MKERPRSYVFSITQLLSFNNPYDIFSKNGSFGHLVQKVSEVPERHLGVVPEMQLKVVPEVLLEVVPEFQSEVVPEVQPEASKKYSK